MRKYTHARVNDTVTGSLKKSTLIPGEEVSIDHLICSTLGRLYSGFGKTDDWSLHRGGCMFVDNVTSWVHVEPQKSFTSHETIGAKERFEVACHDVGVIIQKYLSDNGRAFTSNAVANHLARFEQTARFAGIGAHHHNGIAEKAIQDVMSIERTIMLHWAIHWPEVADAQLWSMAVDHAVFLHNPCLVKTRDSLLMIFSLVSVGHTPNLPMYTLDKTIVDGGKLP
jgi:hypothetical protein